MPRYAALLRGINVGGHKKVAMAELRELLAGLEYAEVVTLLQSGNAAFTAGSVDPDVLAGEIEAAIEAQLGMAVRCLVRRSDELQAVIEANPLREVATDGSKLMAHFLSRVPDETRSAGHDPTALDPASIVLGDRVIYQWCPQGLLAAPDVGAFVLKHWKVTITARNWNTVTKLNALLGRVDAL